MTHEEISTIIAPIIYDVYGGSVRSAQGSYVDVAIREVAQTIATYDTADEPRTREHMIMLRLWDFFSGGSTAEDTAKKIEEALTTGAVTSGAGWPD